MNRREFAAGAAFGLGIAGLGWAGAAQAQVRPPQEGIEYVTLGRPVAVEAPPPRIEVIEFFWYSCPHCNAFEPRLEAWLKRLPKDVAFRRVPVAFQEDFVPQQRLFYTLDAMGKVDELQGKVFQSIHEKREPVTRDEHILAWASRQGLDMAKFQALFRSPEVNSKAYRATLLQDAYKIQGVPALGIAGRYYTDGTLAGGSMERALQITDYLVAQVRKAR